MRDGGFWQLRIVGKSARISITMPSEILAWFAEEAEREGCSRNLLIVEALNRVRCEATGQPYVPYLAGLEEAIDDMRRTG